MKSSTSLRLLATGAAVLLGSWQSAHAQNANVGFVRVTIAIGTATNRLIMESGSLGPVDINVSTKPDPDQKKEIQSYTGLFSAHGHSNWHAHPGPELAVNPTTGSGPLAFYFVNRDGSCRKEILQPGQSHVVMPGEVHMAINESAVSGANLAVIRIHTGDSRQFLPVGSTTPNPDYVPVTVDKPQPTGAGCLVL